MTPPFSEEPSGRNSFTCNLPPDLQRAKLETLVAAIRDRVGVVPRVYKAGRYGIGATTLPILESLGLDIDQSVMPCYDFSPDGPSFMDCDARPFFFGGPRPFLEIPCTSAFVGAAGPAAPAIYGALTGKALAWTRLAGIATRLRIADRLVLSPEGFTLDEMRRVTTALVARGQRVLTLTFHSPSIEPGHTPYVRTTADLEAFLGCLERYLEFFFGELSGTTTTPALLRDALLARAGLSSSLQVH